MKKIFKIAKWVKSRFENVWVDKYPLYWHFIDLFIGLVLGIVFSIFYEATVPTKIGLFFAVFILGYLLTLAFTYGIVRSMNGWTKKRK